MSKLRTNIAYNFIYQFLVLALPLVTAPYLSRVIGAEGTGSYSYSYSIATYFTYFVKLGLDNYGNREIAAVRDDREARSRAFWSIYAMQAFCFAGVAVVYAAYVALVADDRLLAALQGLYVLSSLFDVNWFFFGMERFKMTVTRNTVIKVATAALTFLLVRDSGDTPVYVAIMCGGFLVSQLALWPFLRGLVDWRRPGLREVASRLRPNLVLFVPVVAISVYGTLSKIVLGAISGTEAVGFYESAYKVAQVPVSLVTAVGTVMLPRTSGLVAQGREAEASRYTERTLVAVLALTCLAAFGLPEIAESFTELFYGSGFEEAARALCVLAVTVPLLGFGNVVRSQYLIPHGRDSVFLWSAVCGAVANVVVNLALIPSFGAVGAAWGSVAAEAAVLAYQLARTRHELPLGRYLGFALPFVVAGALMVGALEVFVPRLDSLIADIALRVGVGAAVYAVVAVALVVLSRPLMQRKGKDGV